MCLTRSQRLVVQSANIGNTTNDIDIFVRYGEPAQYNIDLDTADVPVSEGNPQPFYFVNVPTAQRGDVSLDGNETVSIDNPRLGTYYITVVNYDRTQGAQYSLRAAVQNTPPTTPATGTGTAEFK